MILRIAGGVHVMAFGGFHGQTDDTRVRNWTDFYNPGDVTVQAHTVDDPPLTDPRRRPTVGNGLKYTLHVNEKDSMWNSQNGHTWLENYADAFSRYFRQGRNQCQNLSPTNARGGQ